MRPQRFNNDLGPVASWLFDGNLNDSSGNGYHLALDVGSERYCVSGWIPDDGVDRGLCLETMTSNNRFDIAATPAALQIQGSLTIQALVLNPQYERNSQAIVTCDASGSNSSLNKCYQLVQYQAGTYVIWEHSNGTDVQPIAQEGNNPYEWFHIAFTRTDNGDGTSDVAFYKNGHTIHTEAGLTTGTGGSSSGVHVMGSYSGQYFYGMCAGIQIYNFAMTPTQVYNQALRVVPLYAGGP